MQIESRIDGDVLTLRVEESRLDAAIATAFKDTVRSCLAQGGKTVILDLSRVDFMDSSGLGATISVRRMMTEGRSLALRGLTPNVLRVFRLTHMDRVFTILDSPAAPGGSPGPAGRAPGAAGKMPEARGRPGGEGA